MKTTRWAVLAAAGIGVAAVVWGCGGKQAGDGATARVGPFQVDVSNRPEKPIVGDNTLVITVRDSTGTPVRGATVAAVVSMPAMGAMPYMESRGSVVETKPGVYEASYGIQMQGDWDADVRIRAADGRQGEAGLRLSTTRGGLAFTDAATSAAAAGAADTATAAADTVGDLVGIRLDVVRRQEIGVTTEAVAARDLDATILAAGRVAYDETRRADVAPKFGGWARDVRVDYTGSPVRKGETLLTVYSPALFAAEQEYLEALKAGNDADLAQAARQRLLLWDVPASTLDAIASSGKPLEAVPIVAPVGGVVVEKNVVEGSAFSPGTVLYRIAPIDPVWVIASVYQYELPLVRTGMEAGIQVAYLPGASRTGRVSYVNPYLDPSTRTGEVRIDVRNPTGDLKPGMYVDVLLHRSLGKRLAVPESAVLYAGERRIVFVDMGDGRLVPRDVTLGAKAGDWFEVERGLEAGDVVVTSGNFLVAAESRLKAAAHAR
ncbi:MAG: efflux RND transporter periplasmic adaptor subunit [Hyphomicrobiales bacterium]